MRWWDLDRIHGIEVRAFPETAWTEEMFWAELAGVPDSRWYLVAERGVAEQGAEVIGYGGIMTVGADSDVQTIAVDEPARGQGVGRRLLEGLLTESRRRGCSRIFLEVAAGNQKAQRLYETAGFAVEARRRDYYAPGSDALVMQRRLGGSSSP